MPNWKKLLVSGSDANLSSLSVDSSISAASITGSLLSTNGIISSSGDLISGEVIYSIGGSSVSSSNLVYLDTVNERVGIKTTTPQYPFHLVQDTGNALAVYEKTGGAAIFYEAQNAKGALGTVASHPLAFAINSAEVSRINTSGVYEGDVSGSIYATNGVISSSAQVVASLNNQDIDLGTGDITAVTASIDYVLVNDELQGNGPGFQFFAFNEDTIKVKFANWYSSNDRQYGMGQLWFETWFAAIDNNPTLRGNRRIGFYLEEPDAGANDAVGSATAHPSNARFYVDVNGAYLSGSLHVEQSITGSEISANLIGTASYADFATTASYVEGSNVDGTVSSATSASYAVSASHVEFADNTRNAVSASYAVTASYAVSASVEIIKEVSSSYADTASIALSGDGVFSGSFSGSFEGDGSNLTGVGAFPYTGSAGITGSLNLTGNANIIGGANFDVFATPQTASGDSIIPDGYYAKMFGPVLVSGTVTVGTGSILKVEPF